jgi:PPOX class probable FMN-dependent enzyme
MEPQVVLNEVVNEEQLREVLGYPSGRAVTKERTRLHQIDREWLAASPFCILATSDSRGCCDASPKGDPAGSLIHVLDDARIAIAERPGNKRADGYLNVLDNPHAGIISLIPGRPDTLRINGRARVVRDASFFDEMIVRGQRPILAIVLDIEQIFFHCSKAFMRSELWEPETWQPEKMTSRAAMTKALQDTPETLEELEEYYDPANYAKGLY